ncbi:ATP-grasp domain-containing protein [Salinibacterium soli]|uniref:ATP-grasp domain-containing protein n=1 Tax=Antiquaquibacter soli TaxID=3064523 RepID=A0ABT9BK31_9MICO|nr:ATP-grasp domain-containing protein [Protaetiibacter sp. WY-16]MDO7881369.1 ATP-grasp domain-containing protein [Protaetiibacter sp. WY-16]
MTRVLVTGAGGPAGVAVLRSLLRRPDVTVFAADMDGWASGLYLVPAGQRRLVEPGRSPSFVDGVVALVAADSIDVVFSTVDVELPPLAARRDELGAVLAAPSLETLEVTLDKFLLAERCAPLLRTPETALHTEDGIARDWEFPVIVKPRRGAGSRGVRVVADRAGLQSIPADDALIIQEFLPGDEYSVDVFADARSHVIAAVPRTRTRVDSGVSIAGRTVHDEALQSTAAAVAAAIGLSGVANVQLRRDRAGIPALLEVNPRFPGALPLTIAAGVDMPSLALDLALGADLPESLDFADLANVRYLEDVFIDPAAVLVSEYAAHGDEDG